MNTYIDICIELTLREVVFSQSGLDLQQSGQNVGCSDVSDDIAILLPRYVFFKRASRYRHFYSSSIYHYRCSQAVAHHFKAE